MRLIGRIIKWFIILFFSTSILAVLVLRFVPVYFTPLMVIRSAQQISKGEKIVLHHTWVPKEKISNNLKRAVIASEDQQFFYHWGFDVKQIQNAVEENGRRRRPRGASTISQQTAKNVFLWPQSSWYRKGIEVYFTVLIEAFWSKDRILEVYLNSIEMGKGIYGAEAVAKDHFKTTAAKLSAGKAALIAASLPSPLHFNSQYPSRYLFMRQAEILQQMRYIELPKNK